MLDEILSIPFSAPGLYLKNKKYVISEKNIIRA
jgi:hypothetical protein